MAASSPTRVIEAFGHCARAVDEDGARELSVGWDAVGNAPRRLFKQAAAARWELRILGSAWVEDDRAVQQATLYRPETRRTEGALWIHLVRRDDRWFVAGAQSNRRVASLFLAGKTPAVWTTRDLPGSPQAEAFGETMVERIREDVLTSIDQLSDTWDIPLLARIPAFPCADDRAPSLQAVDSSHPALMAHARLRDAVAEHPRLLFTSSVAGEGKSTLAANMAYARALLGQQVVLVDGDLRMPRVWRRWGADAGPGLCEVVHGLEVDKALQNTAVTGVRLLSAGRAPKDPAAILARSQSALMAAAGQADVVVIDGAPAVEFDDAFTLADAAGAQLVVVVELGKTRRSQLRALRERCEARGVQPLGLVANRTLLDEAGELRAFAPNERVQVQVTESRALPAVHRAAVALQFARPGEAGRTEWLIVDTEGEQPVQVGRSLVMTNEVLLMGLEVEGPEAAGEEWKAEKVRRAFDKALRRGVDTLEKRTGAASREPAAAFAQIIRTLVADAAAQRTVSVPRVPVRVGKDGRPVKGAGPAVIPTDVRQSVLDAVEQVLGERVARGETELTPEDIRAHGPELAREVIGAVLKGTMGQSLTVEGEDGKPVKMQFDLANLFAGMLSGRTGEGSP